MTIEIPLTRGYVTIVDDCDSDLAKKKWSLSVSRGKMYGKKWGTIEEGHSTISIHRVILSRIIGREMLKNECVDHIDGNGLNNVRANLRLSTHSQNVRNRRLSHTNKSGYKGVFKKGCRYAAKIQVDKKGIHLGTFNTPEEAHEAYKKAAIRYFGEFARFE